METTSNFHQQRGRRSSLELIHLDVPLISTRRSSSPAGTCSPDLQPIDTSRRVPFLWERVPGVPKDGMRRPPSSQKKDDFFYFPPKPPPGRRRHPPVRTGYNSEDDDGNDGGVDSNSNGDSVDMRFFREALDKVCLPYSPAVDYRETRGLHRSPSFIMNRFLLAANVMAASSPPIIPKHGASRPPPTLPHRLQRELLKSRRPKTTNIPETGKAITMQQPRQPHLPSKACGLQVFFPWAYNQTPCGHKSPVLCQTQGAGVETVGKKNRRFSFDVLRGIEKVEDDLSSKAFKSPGWGLPFLDTSRLRLRGRGDETYRGRQSMTAMRGSGKPTWSLPRLQKPSEPWLLRALNNANRKQ